MSDGEVTASIELDGYANLDDKVGRVLGGLHKLCPKGDGRIDGNEAINVMVASLIVLLHGMPEPYRSEHAKAISKALRKGSPEAVAKVTPLYGRA